MEPKAENGVIRLNKSVEDRPSQKIVEEQQKQVSKTVEKRPDYNFGPILPF